MQLEEEIKLLHKLVDVMIKEACWDYSGSARFAVLNINGNPVVLNKHNIETLCTIRKELEGGKVSW